MLRGGCHVTLLGNVGMALWEEAEALYDILAQKDILEAGGIRSVSNLQSTMGHV